MPRKILVADLLCGAGGSSTGCEPAREEHAFTARVYLREASRRRADRSFHATLLQWAANARRRFIAAKPAQGELFSQSRAEGRAAA
jgi:hypothetical protein